MKKIAYFGMKNDYGDENRPLAYDYIHIYQTLETMGYECFFFDYLTYLKTHTAKQLQDAVIHFVLANKINLAIFSLYREEIEEKTIAKITEVTKTFGIFMDDTWRRDFVVKFGQQMNFFTTTDPFGEIIYKNLKLKSEALYFSYGFNPKYYYPEKQSYQYDVSFVGSWSSSREWVIRELKKKGITVEVFGHGWANGVVSHAEMVSIFQKSKISLNLSNSVQDNLSYVFSSIRAVKNYFSGPKKGEQLKGRHVEINACGGFQISFYADGLPALYEIGKEIDVYQSVDDLSNKIKFYLANEDIREEIAKRGLLRSQNYKYSQVLLNLFKKMDF